MTDRTTPLRILVIGALAACGPALLAPAAVATSTVGLDAATLNELLPALTPNEIEVALAGSQTVRVLLEDLEVTGFDPSAGDSSSGQILTRVRVKIPDLGISVPVEPRLSLGVVNEAGEALLELRFEQAEISLPLMGSIDIGTFIPPLRFPAENIFLLQGGEGDVSMRSRVTDVKMGQTVLRFEFEIEREE